MDFHALPRRDLQALAKRNGIRANMTNGAMADALAALPAVDGIEEYVQQPVAEPTPAAEPVVQPTAEEEEKPEISLPPDEVVVLDDSEEDKDLTPDEDEEKAPARGVGRRRVAWAEPLAATAKRNRAAARKADTAEAVAEAIPARATRARSQRTVETDADTAEAVPEAVPARATRARSQRAVEPVAADEAPKTRRTSRRAAGRKAGTQQEEEEKATQGDASDVEPAMAAPVSSDDGRDTAEEMEAAVDAQNEEQHAPVEEQSQEVEGENEKEDAAAVAVPARATRARSQRKVLSAAEEVASRRTMDALNEEQQAQVEEQNQEVEGDTEKEDMAAAPVPARATRARRQRTVSSVAEEEAPKTRRTSRRAVANNNSTEQEDEEKATRGDVSDVEAYVPAPVSEEMAEAMDAQNVPIEVHSEEDEGETEKGATAVEAVPARATRARRQRAVLSVAEEAMPARATRARSQKTVVPVAEEEGPKGRRTSRRAAAQKTSAEQEEEEKRTQGDVSDMEADVPAPVSSDEEQNEAVCGSEEMEAAMDAQNEEQTTLVEEPSQEGEIGTMHEEGEQGQPQQDTVSDVETAVPAASSDEEGDCAEEIEASMDAEDEEQTEQAEEQSREDEGAVANGTPLVEEPAAAEDCPVYSSVVEQTGTVSSEEILHSSEDTEMVPVQEVPEATEEVNFSSDVSEENEHCTGEEEPPVAEDVDSSVHESPVDVEHASEDDEECKIEEELQVAEDVQHASEENEDCKVEEELPVAEDVQQCDATEEIQLASEETEMVPIKEMSQAMLESGEATEEVDCTSDVDEENEEFEEESTLAELVDSSVQEPQVHVQQCETTEKIQLAKEDTEMVPVLGSGEATEEVDFTSDVDEENEEFEEESTLAELVDSSVQAPQVHVQQCETTEKIQLAREDTEMVPVLESGEATEEVDFTSDVVHASEENDVPTCEEVLQSTAKASEKKKDMSAEEVTNNTNMAAEEVTNNTNMAAEGETLVATDEMPQMLEAMDEDVAVKESGFTEEIQLASEETEMVPIKEMSQAMLESGEATEEVDCTSDVDEENEEFEEESTLAELVDSSVQEPQVHVQQCETTEKIQLAKEDTEMVPVLGSGEATEEVDFTSDVDEENEEFEEESTLAELVDSSVQVPQVHVQQCETTEKIQLAREDTEMVPVLESGEATEEVDFTSDVVHASEENDVPTCEEVLQSTAKASEKKKDMSAEEVTNNTNMAAEEVTNNTNMAAEGETLVATDEMPQMLEAMDEDVAVKESGFTADLTDVSIEEEAEVAANEKPLSLARMGECVEEEVVTVDHLPQATVTDDEGAVKESGVSCGLTHVSADDGVVAADVMLQSSATKEENAEEVVAIDNQSEAMVTDDEVHVKGSGFPSEHLDVFIEEQGVVADDAMLHSSSTMEENVEEVVTVDNMWQATVTGDEGAAKENGFWDHLAHMSVDKEDVVEADEMQVSSATIEKSVDLVVTVDKQSQATVADEEWAVTESAFTGECTPAVDTARDFSDHIASPWSANVFEYATKSLSMDSVTVVSEPVAVQRENDVKEGNEPEAALGKTIHSPLTIRKLRRAVAEENEADDVPLCIFIGSSGGEENSAEPVLVEEENEVNQPEATLAKITHSPLTIRKLRRAVAEENEADDVPLCIFTSSSGDEENSAELVLVEREKEVNKPEAALAKIAHSPLTIRKLRRAVAEENEADDVPLCIFTSSTGGEENSAEPVLVELEKEVNDHEALSSLSLRKLRTEFNQIVAVAKENEVKEGEKSSQALDNLSLRKLRTKLKETLNAHKNVEPKRVPLGRLDENAC